MCANTCDSFEDCNAIDAESFCNVPAGWSWGTCMLCNTTGCSSHGDCSSKVSALATTVGPAAPARWQRGAPPAP